MHRSAALLFSSACFVAWAASGDVAPRQDYAAVARTLAPFIEHQLAGKQLPAISIALIDDQQIVWAQGFGLADPDKKIAATAGTIYRVG